MLNKLLYLTTCYSVIAVAAMLSTLLVATGAIDWNDPHVWLNLNVAWFVIMYAFFLSTVLVYHNRPGKHDESEGSSTSMRGQVDNRSASTDNLRSSDLRRSTSMENIT